MPPSVQIGLLVVGAILLVLALTKGGLKMFNAEVSESAGQWPRIISGVLGLLFILMSVGMTELRKHEEPAQPKPELPAPVPDDPTPAPVPRPAMPVEQPSTEPHLDLGWRALNALEGAQVFAQLSPQAQQAASATAYAALSNGEDIYAVELEVTNDSAVTVNFSPDKLQFSVNGQYASVINIEHPRRLKAQRLAAAAHRSGFVFVRASSWLGNALQLGQGTLGYADEGLAVSSNHH